VGAPSRQNLPSLHASLHPSQTATGLAALEDAVDLAPSAADAGAVFAWVEAAHGAGRLGPPAYAADRAKLALLRTANALLRRASRVAAPGLRGRALLFLARACPLADKSGLNLLGAVNTGHPLRAPSVPDGAADCGGRPIDASLYATFWGLQAPFQDPYSLVKAPSAWTAFAAGLREVLAAYKATPFSVGAATGKGSGGGGGGGVGDAPAAPPPPPTTTTPAPDPGVVEYLAAPALFPLQLADPAARRPVLLQALITLHALRHLPPRVAAAAPGGGLTGPAAAEASALEASLYAELARTPPDGPSVAAGVAAALAGEGGWSAWKHRSAPPCPPFERAAAGPPPSPAGGAIADTAAAAAGGEPGAGGRPAKRARPGGGAGATAPPLPGLGSALPPSLGTPDLDRLWSLTPDGPASCLKVADRGHAPSLRDFLGRVALEMDPEAGVEAAARGSADPVYLWKALRLLARSDLATFSAVLAARGAGGLEVAVRALYPGDVPEGAVRAEEAAAEARAAAAAAAKATAEAEEAAEEARAEAEAGAVEEAPPSAAPGAGDRGAGEEEGGAAVEGEEGAAAAEVEAEEQPPHAPSADGGGSDAPKEEEGEEGEAAPETEMAD